MDKTVLFDVEEIKNASIKETLKEVFEIMIKYNFISKDTAKKLVENKKIKIDNADEIIKKYN